MKKGVIIFSCFLMCHSAGAQQISTYAGNRGYGSYGDGGAATNAGLNNPQGLATDASGNLYIADQDNHKIRKVTPAGVMSTFAGNGGYGTSGDGGQATNAPLSSPTAVAIDASGNVYIADAGYYGVRKVSTSGVITRFAGNGSNGYTGDGGAATAAEIGNPMAVTVDNSGNVYIADANNYVVRKVDASGTISTYAGDGSYGYSGDGGAATAAEITFVYGMATDASGNLYLADNGNIVLRKVSPSGVISTFAGNGSYSSGGDGGPATATGLGAPWGICVDGSGNVYIVDELYSTVRKVNTSGIISTYAGTSSSTGYSGDGGPATAATFDAPEGIAVDPSGNLFINDNANNVIRKVGTGLNHAPYFTAAGTINLCENSGAFPITENLAAADRDAGQTLTWSVATPPSHGIASISYSTSTTGSILRPAGVYYTPTTNYSGPDSIWVMVSDGTASDTKLFVVTVYSLPSAPIISGPVSICYHASTTLTATPSGGTWSCSDANATITAGGVVTGIGGGPTHISYISPADGHSCRNQAYTTLSITGVPNPGSIIGTGPVCPGASTTFTPTVPSGTWSSGNVAVASVSAAGSITGIAAGTALITYTVNNGCYSAYTTWPVTVSGGTAVGVIGGIPYFFMPATLTMTNPVAGGTWSSSNTSIATISATGVITGVTAGVDTIIYSYTNGCGITSSAMKAIRVYPTHGGRVDGGENGGAENATAGTALNIYPNPTNGIVSVSLEGQLGQTSVIVYNLIGKVVASGNSDNNQMSLDFSNLPSGTYMLMARNNGISYTSKIIVQ